LESGWITFDCDLVYEFGGRVAHTPCYWVVAAVAFGENEFDCDIVDCVFIHCIGKKGLADGLDVVEAVKGSGATCGES